MGDIISQLIGGAGSIYGAQQGAKADLTGFNYLTGNATQNGYINNGGAANSAESQLLGLSPITSGTQNGFQNYLNSTGYNFQKTQGENAITGNAATKGLLNSGSDLKAVQTFGNNLAANSFNNYLGQLSGVSQQGQVALGQNGDAGTAGGQAAGRDLSSGYSSGFSQAGQGIGGLFGFMGF